MIQGLLLNAMKPFGLVNITCWIAVDTIEIPHLLLEKKL